MDSVSIYYDAAEHIIQPWSEMHCPSLPACSMSLGLPLKHSRMQHFVAYFVAKFCGPLLICCHNACECATIPESFAVLHALQQQRESGGNINLCDEEACISQGRCSHRMRWRRVMSGPLRCPGAAQPGAAPEISTLRNIQFRPRVTARAIA